MASSGPVLAAQVNQQLVNRHGSRSWTLRNKAGTTDMIRGEMDITFVDGSPEEFITGIEILDQRVRKSVTEPQGSNQFAVNWGSVLATLLGQKVFGRSTLNIIAESLIDMIEQLIDLQSETLLRLDLEPSELIESVGRIQITAEGTTISASAQIITQAKTVEEILIPEAFDVISNS